MKLLLLQNYYHLHNILHNHTDPVHLEKLTNGKITYGGQVRKLMYVDMCEWAREDVVSGCLPTRRIPDCGHT